MDNRKTLQAIRDNIKKVIVGKDDAIDLMLVSLVCSGHVLVEDVPGLGKTTMVSALADSLGCSFQRIQFTPDVLPSDITGFNMFNMQTGEKEFHVGNIMKQIILADEINRASPKTQSALLEAMQERQVTVDGKTYNLPVPFMVLATQNPVDMAGTYPLPEAQLDRFFMHIQMGYPEHGEEIDILKRHRIGYEHLKLTPVADTADILALQQAVKKVYCDEELLDYIVKIVEATRVADGVMTGASPRGSIALMQAACGYAMLNGRDFITPDDIKKMVPSVLGHRIILRARSGAMAATEQVLQTILKSIPVPKVKV